MTSTPHSRARALVAVAALYAISGVVYGFASFVLVPTLSRSGVALVTQTAVWSLAGVPWVLKMLWAPLVDAPRFVGRAVGLARWASWVAGAGLVLTAVVLPSEAMVALAWLWLLTNVALSLMDVATDAFVLDVATERSRGVASGVMLGARDVGMYALGGLGLGAVVGASSLQTGTAWLGVGVVALGACTFVARGVVPRPRPSIDGAAVRMLLRRPRSLVIGLVGALSLTADVATSAVSGEFLVQRVQWSFEDITGRLPWWLAIGSVVGYAVASVSVDRLGHARAAVLGATGLAAVWLGFAGLESQWMHPTVIIALVLTQAIPTAMLYAGLYAWLMDATEPAVRATHFAVLMALLNLPRVFAPLAMAAIVERWAWGGAYAAAGLFEAMAAVALLWVARGRGTASGRGQS